MNPPESAESYSIAERETRMGRGRSEGANPKPPSTSRLPPSTNHTPLTKEQIKRRSFWINFGMFALHIAVWTIFSIWLYNGGRPK